MGSEVWSLNEGRDIIPATPRLVLASASCLITAQRRPGYYPGDTSLREFKVLLKSSALNEGRDIIPATPSSLSRRLVGLESLNEGRDIIPATPCKWITKEKYWARAQRRPGYYPGDTHSPAMRVLAAGPRSTKAGILSRRHPSSRPSRRPAAPSLNEGRDIIPATPREWRTHTPSAGSLNEGRDIIPATPSRTPTRRLPQPPRSTKAGILSRRHRQQILVAPGAPLRSTKAGILSRRHPKISWKASAHKTPLNEGRDIIPATPTGVATIADGTFIAQRRPGYYPGDTLHNRNMTSFAHYRSTKAGILSRRHQRHQFGRRGDVARSTKAGILSRRHRSSAGG